MSNYTNELNAAIEIARGAGEILREGVRTMSADSHIDFKSSAVDPVTEYDRRSEDFIVAQLRKTFPRDALVGEEGGAYAATRDTDLSRKWYVDPIDGTVNFAHGVPIFAVSMGLWVNGVPSVGVVYNPMSGELFTAMRGAGAFLNGAPIHVSRTAQFQRALLGTGFPYDRATSARNNFDNFMNFKRTAQAVRRLGSAALDMCFVACGRFDGYWEFNLKPHDFAAAILIAQEAGGICSTFDGTPPRTDCDEIVCSNGLIHARMLEVLRQ